MRTESIAAHLTTAYRAARDQGFLTNGQMLGGNVVQVSHCILSSAWRGRRTEQRKRKHGNSESYRLRLPTKLILACGPLLHSRLLHSSCRRIAIPAGNS